jgi:DNA-binding transcriptional LysR family regulator
LSAPKVDLNLFALFDAMLKHGSVSAASRHLGVSASAGSHGLARLRRLLADELFVPGPDGMQPTARASELAPDIQDGLSKIAAALERRTFDPAVTSRVFAIAATDYATILILPHLARRLAKQAPHAQIRIFPPNRMDMVQHLEEGRLDLALGWFETLPPRIGRKTLRMEQEAVVVRAGHPLTRGRLTKERLLSYPHVVVELSGSEQVRDDGYIDDRGVVRRMWIERLLIETGYKKRPKLGRVAVTVPRYSDIPPMLEISDMVATLPGRLAWRAVERDGLAVLALPYPPLVVPHEVIWHERAVAEASVGWLLGQLELTMAEIGDGEPVARLQATA